ncbi:MAG: tetratricopeptide repeat protein [Verrucomicrobiae bacterium]|nr:tetratricopeptide repeat protein [Verrucomicrobiae bacterium]
MVATKNQAGRGSVFLLLLAGVLAGCMPPGPRALIEGRRLLDKGQSEQAVERLLVATSVLTTNASAWNYLGLAYHRTGQHSNAVVAYQKAVALDRELVEARYNLGALWLEQNRLEAAKTELTAYTLRRGDVVEGWLKLGTTQLRLRELTAAEQSFRAALRINAQHPEAFNGLGLVQAQRNRPREAVQFFSAALKQRPDYSPARLNLATVLHQQLHDVPGALQVYREYLALKPPPPGFNAVSALAQALEQQLAAAQRALLPTNTVSPVPPAVTATTPTVTPTVPVVTSTPPVVTATIPVVTATNVTPPATTAVERVVSPVKVDPPPPVAKPTPVAPDSSPAPAEIVDLPSEPVLQITPPATPEVAIAIPAETQVVEAVPPAKLPLIPVDPPTTAEAEKPGFFARVNPLRVFRRESKPPPQAITLPPSETIAAVDAATAERERVQDKSISNAPVTAMSAPPDSAQPAAASSFLRYPYLSPSAPAAGNRQEADRAFAQGQRAQQANRLSEAMQAYRQATVADPAYFEAYYSLGLTAYEARNHRQALAAWETALALRPDSTDARYNFALVLKAANYPVDAARELEKLVAANSQEARAHLVLGNLYAEQLGNSSRARTHYLKVLEIDPRNAQATAIRYWLVAHPP